MISHVVRAAVATATTVAASAALLAAPAEAAPQGDPIRQGKVVTAQLNVRHLPTTASASKGTIGRGQTLEIICKVHGTSVGGNDIWYALPPTLNEWVSARYVQNVGAAPGWCGSEARFVGRSTTALAERQAPTRAAARARTVARGTTLDIVCKLPGQAVDGNNRWYYLSNGDWVAARYVSNVGAAPDYCN